MVAKQKSGLMTAEELMALPDDGNRYELEEGRLITMPPSGWKSSRLGVRFAVKLGGYIDAHGLGEYAGADGGIRLARNPDTVRAPDFTFVSNERVSDPGQGYYEGAPDLVVEVLSPSDRWATLRRKATRYIEAGVRLVWLVDPERRRAEVYRADGTMDRLTADGILDGEDVLPGYTLPLSKMWV